jgi:hypothetical protein
MLSTKFRKFLLIGYDWALPLALYSIINTEGKECEKNTNFEAEG